MYITQDIATRIKAMTKIKKVTQKEMLSQCGININAITEFAKGKQLSCISLAKIADYLDCSVDYLLGRTDSPASYHQDNNSGNIINGSNGNNSPLTVNGAEQLDEMTAELVKAFRSLPFRDRLDVINMVMEKSSK